MSIVYRKLRPGEVRPGLRVFYRPYPGAPRESGVVIRRSAQTTYIFIQFDRGVGRTPKAVFEDTLEVQEVES